MAERQGFIDRVKGAERESYVVAAAIAHYTPAALVGEASLPPRTSPRDLMAAADQAESTYLVRMWAEFETALRSYRRRRLNKPDDEIKTRNLIDWMAGIRQGRAISASLREDVQEVREYRNFLVHQRDDDDPPAPMTIEEARRRLNTFLHRLPDHW